MGITHEQLDVVTTEELKQVVASGEIVIRVEAETLEKILADGRFKNLFEVAGRSFLAQQPVAERAKLERELYGLGHDHPAELRPIHARIRISQGDWRLEALLQTLAEYGSVDIVVGGASVLERTTVCVGSPTFTKVIPSPATDPKPQSFGATPSGHGEFGYFGLEGIGRDYAGERFRRSALVQAQIHNGLTVPEITLVVFHRPPLNQRLYDTLDALGIPWLNTFDDSVLPPWSPPAAPSLPTPAASEPYSQQPTTANPRRGEGSPGMGDSPPGPVVQFHDPTGAIDGRFKRRRPGEAPWTFNRFGPENPAPQKRPTTPDPRTERPDPPLTGQPDTHPDSAALAPADPSQSEGDNTAINSFLADYPEDIQLHAKTPPRLDDATASPQVLDTAYQDAEPAAVDGADATDPEEPFSGTVVWEEVDLPDELCRDYPDSVGGVVVATEAGDRPNSLVLRAVEARGPEHARLREAVNAPWTVGVEINGFTANCLIWYRFYDDGPRFALIEYTDMEADDPHSDAVRGRIVAALLDRLPDGTLEIQEDFPSSSDVRELAKPTDPTVAVATEQLTFVRAGTAAERDAAVADSSNAVLHADVTRPQPGARRRMMSAAEFAARLARAERSGRPARIRPDEWDTQNSVTELLIYPDGLWVVEKSLLGPKERAAEIVASAYAYALDAPVPPVIPVDGDDRAVRMPWLPGELIESTADDPGGIGAMEALRGHPDAEQLGLLDLVIGNWDRAENVLRDGDELFGVDHAFAFERPIDPNSSPFSKSYVSAVDPDREPDPYEWVANGRSRSQLERYKRNVEALQPLCEEYDCADWHRDSLPRLDKLIEHGRDTRTSQNTAAPGAEQLSAVPTESADSARTGVDEPDSAQTVATPAGGEGGNGGGSDSRGPGIDTAAPVVMLETTAEVVDEGRASDDDVLRESASTVDTESALTATDSDDSTEISDQPTAPTENSQVYHRLMAELGNPLIARNLAARVHARAAREQLPADTEAARQRLFDIAKKVLGEHRAAMAQLEEFDGNQPAPKREPGPVSFQRGGVFNHNLPGNQPPENPDESTPAKPTPNTDGSVTTPNSRLLQWIRSKGPRPENKNLALLFGGSGISAMGGLGLAGVIPPLIYDMSGSAQLTGFATAATQLAALLAQGPAGQLADMPGSLERLGKLSTIGAGVAAFGGGWVLSGMPGALEAVIGSAVVLRAIDTIAATSTMIYGRRLAETKAQKDASITLSLLERQAAGAFGGFIFPSLERVSSSLPFFADAASYAVNRWMLNKLPPVTSEPTTQTRLLDGARAVWRDPYLRYTGVLLLPSTFALWSGGVQLAEMINTAGYSATTTGLLLSSSSTGVLLAAAAATRKRFMDRISVKWMHPLMLTAFGGLMAEYATTSNPLIIWPTSVVTGSLMMFSNQKILEYQAEVVPVETLGKANAASAIVGIAGGMFGSAFGGSLLERAGGTVTGLTDAALLVGSAAVSVGIAHATRNRPNAGWSLQRLFKARKLLDCINQTSEATWALGLNTGIKPKWWQKSPKHLQRAIGTQLVKIEFDPDTENPIAKTIDAVQNEDGVDTAVLFIDDGEDMHSLTVTNTDNKSGGDIVIFDTNIKNPGDPHTDRNDRDRIPRVRILDKWKETYPDIKEAYVAFLTTDDEDNLTNRYAYQPGLETPRNRKVLGPMQGRPDDPQDRRTPDQETGTARAVASAPDTQHNPTPAANSENATSTGSSGHGDGVEASPPDARERLATQREQARTRRDELAERHGIDPTNLTPGSEVLRALRTNSTQAQAILAPRLDDDKRADPPRPPDEITRTNLESFKANRDMLAAAERVNALDAEIRLLDKVDEARSHADSTAAQAQDLDTVRRKRDEAAAELAQQLGVDRAVLGEWVSWVVTFLETNGTHDDDPRLRNAKQFVEFHSRTAAAEESRILDGQRGRLDAIAQQRQAAEARREQARAAIGAMADLVVLGLPHPALPDELTAPEYVEFHRWHQQIRNLDKQLGALADDMLAPRTEPRPVLPKDWAAEHPELDQIADGAWYQLSTVRSDVSHSGDVDEVTAAVMGFDALNREQRWALVPQPHDDKRALPARWRDRIVRLGITREMLDSDLQLALQQPDDADPMAALELQFEQADFLRQRMRLEAAVLGMAAAAELAADLPSHPRVHVLDYYSGHFEIPAHFELAIGDVDAADEVHVRVFDQDLTATSVIAAVAQLAQDVEAAARDNPGKRVAWALRMTGGAGVDQALPALIEDLSARKRIRDYYATRPGGRPPLPGFQLVSGHEGADELVLRAKQDPGLAGLLLEAPEPQSDSTVRGDGSVAFRSPDGPPVSWDDLALALLLEGANAKDCAPNAIDALEREGLPVRRRTEQGPPEEMFAAEFSWSTRAGWLRGGFVADQNGTARDKAADLLRDLGPGARVAVVFDRPDGLGAHLYLTKADENGDVWRRELVGYDPREEPMEYRPREEQWTRHVRGTPDESGATYFGVAFVQNDDVTGLRPEALFDPDTNVAATPGEPLADYPIGPMGDRSERDGSSSGPTQSQTQTRSPTTEPLHETHEAIAPPAAEDGRTDTPVDAAGVHGDKDAAPSVVNRFDDAESAGRPLPETPWNNRRQPSKPTPWTGSKGGSDSAGPTKGTPRRPAGFIEFRAGLCAILAADVKAPDPAQALAEATAEQILEAIDRLPLNQRTALRGLDTGKPFAAETQSDPDEIEDIVVEAADSLVKAIVRAERTRLEALRRALAEADQSQLQKALALLGAKQRRIVLSLFRERIQPADLAVAMRLEQPTIKLMADGAIRRIARHLADKRRENLWPAQEQSPDSFSGGSIVHKESELLVDVLSRLEELYASQVASPRDVVEPGVTHRLTPRQIAILRLMAKGKTFPEIAVATGTSKFAVQAQKAAIVREFGISDRNGIVEMAIRNGIIDDSDSQDSNNDAPAADGAAPDPQVESSEEPIEPTVSPAPLNSVALSKLSRREADVVGLAALGLSNREIGQRLSISPHTAEDHLGRAARKMDTRGRDATIAEATRPDVRTIALTEVEAHTLRLVADGMSRATVGAVLGATPKQVQRFLTQLADKVGADGPLQVIPAPPDTDPTSARMSQSQLERLRIVVGTLPTTADRDSTTVSPDAVQDFRIRIAAELGTGDTGPVDVTRSESTTEAPQDGSHHWQTSVAEPAPNQPHTPEPQQRPRHAPLIGMGALPDADAPLDGGDFKFVPARKKELGVLHIAGGGAQRGNAEPDRPDETAAEAGNAADNGGAPSPQLPPGRDGAAAENRNADAAGFGISAIGDIIGGRAEGLEPDPPLRREPGAFDPVLDGFGRNPEGRAFRLPGKRRKQAAASAAAEPGQTPAAESAPASPAEPSQEPEESVSPKQLLTTNRAYRAGLYIPNAISNIGFSIQESALPLAMLELTHSPVAAGFTSFAPLAAKALSEPLAGYAADFHDRVEIMRTAQWTSVTAATVAAAAVGLGVSDIGPVLTGTTLVEGVAATFYLRSLLGTVRDLVTPEQLMAANRMAEIDRYVAGTGGRALGPIVLNVANWLPFAANGLSSLWNLRALSRLREAVPRHVPTDGRAFRDLFHDIRDGGRAVWDEPFLREYTLATVATNAAFGILNLRTATIIDEAHMHAVATAAVVSASAIGGVIGGLLPKKLISKTKANLLYPAALFGFAGVAALQAATPNPFVVAAGALGTSIIGVGINVRVAGHLQQAIPEELYGRANSAKDLVMYSGAAAGPLLGGALLSTQGIFVPGWISTGIIGAAAVGVAAHHAAAIGGAAHQLIRRLFGLRQRGSETLPVPDTESSGAHPDSTRADGTDPLVELISDVNTAQSSPVVDATNDDGANNSGPQQKPRRSPLIGYPAVGENPWEEVNLGGARKRAPQLDVWHNNGGGAARGANHNAAHESENTGPIVDDTNHDDDDSPGGGTATPRPDPGPPSGGPASGTSAVPPTADEAGWRHPGGLERADLGNGQPDAVGTENRSTLAGNDALESATESASGPRRRAKPIDDTGLLPREVEVLQLTYEGLSRDEIAARLGLSPGTVSNYNTSAAKKLNTASIIAAVVKARRRGLLTTTDTPASTDFDLSEDEIELLQLIAEGRTNQQIAHKRKVTRQTVERHRVRIGEKLGVRESIPMAMMALRLGIIDDARSNATEPPEQNTSVDSISDGATGVPAETPSQPLIRHVLPPDVHATEILDSERSPALTLRLCAERMLHGLELQNEPIPIAPNGAPRWPAGLVGDATGTGRYAATAAAPGDVYRAIGLDAKDHAPAHLTARPGSIRHGERLLVRDLASAHPGIHWDQVLASAKDNVIDLQFQLAGVEIRPDDVDVTLRPDPAHPESGSIEVHPAIDQRRASPRMLFSGRFQVGGGTVLTAFAVRHGSDSPEPAPEAAAQQTNPDRPGQPTPASPSGETAANSTTVFDEVLAIAGDKKAAHEITAEALAQGDAPRGAGGPPPPGPAVPFHEFDLHAALDLPTPRRHRRPRMGGPGFAGIPHGGVDFHHDPDNARELGPVEQPSIPPEVDAPPQNAPDDPPAATPELAPPLRRALETAEKDAAEVAAEGLRLARNLGMKTEEAHGKEVEAVEQVIEDLQARQRRRFDTALRRLVVDGFATLVLRDEAEQLVPKAAEHFELLKPHIKNARNHVHEVRTALAVLAARDVLKALGAEPLLDDDGHRIEGIGVVPGQGIVVASPLLGQQNLVDELMPRLREWAAQEGIPIEYLQVLIDENAQLTVQAVPGDHTEPEPAIQYYVNRPDTREADRDAKAWLNDLADERSFAEKLIEAEASGEVVRIRLTTVDHHTSSASVYLIIYRNGYQAVLKKVREKVHADAEKLGARTLRDAGARAPEVLRLDDLTLMVEYVPGIPANKLFWHGKDGWREHFPTPAAMRQGLGDMLIRPWDRHEGANWLLAHGFQIVPIDNSNAYQDEWPKPKGFSDHFWAIKNGLATYIKHHIPSSELDDIRERIRTSESEYLDLRHWEWYSGVIRIFEEIAAQAEDAMPPTRKPIEVLRILGQLRDDLADQFGLPYPHDTRTSPEWRSAIAELRQTYTDSSDPEMLGYVDTLEALVKLHLHAQLNEVSADELDGTWETEEPVDGTRVELIDTYLEGLSLRLADLAEGAHYPDPNGETDAQWQTRFDRAISSATFDSKPKQSPTAGTRDKVDTNSEDLGEVRPSEGDQAEH
ncbi:MFS transporter [Nocardia sp. NPDC004604]|uniref:MFS transporter n=1 Tax=Nocardia sp. NPDC004604 TaxID=3157013 RepID=UPI0033A3B8B8